MAANKTFEFLECTHCPNRGSSVFCNLHGESLEQISDSKSCCVFRKGQIIFHEGGNPYGVYCIKKGKVKLSIVGDEGREQIVRLAGDGDLLGYRSLLVGERYNASAVALEDSQVCFVPRDVFTGAVKHDANLSYEMLKLLSNQLKDAEVKLTHLAQKSVRERLAETLLFLKETYGYEPDSTYLNVRLSREEIANLVGTATETVIRLLADFNKESLVVLEGKKIMIANIKGLMQVANLQD